MESHRNYIDIISIDLYLSQRQLRNNIVITRSYVPFRGRKCIVSFGWITDTIRATRALLVYWSQLPSRRNANPFSARKYMGRSLSTSTANTYVRVVIRLVNVIPNSIYLTRYSRNNRIFDRCICYLSCFSIKPHSYTDICCFRVNCMFQMCQFV